MKFSKSLSLLLASALLQSVSPAPVITVKEGISAHQRKEVDFDVSLFKPLVHLNEVSFDKSVLMDSNNGVRRWVVLFCLGWYDTCAAFERPFMEFARDWENRLNTDLLSTEVRFATVDCATDRVLCNEQGIHQFPKVVMYEDHHAGASWTSSGTLKQIISSLESWGRKQLDPIMASRSTDESDEDLSFLDWAHSMIPGRNDFGLDIFVLLLVMLGNAWIVSRNPELRAEHKPEKNPEPTVPEAPQSIGRFLPEDWATERPHLDL